MCYNILMNTVFVAILYLICKLECHKYVLDQIARTGERRLTEGKIDEVFEKYIAAVKKLSADFPNHQIELHLDVAGADVQRPRGRFNYIHLRKPTHLTDNQKRAIRSAATNTTETTQIAVPPISLLSDPEMQPVYMKDLKKAIEDLDRKYSKQIASNEPPQGAKPNINIKQIMQLLQKGTLVQPNAPKPPEDNVSWFQIKVPSV